MDGMYGLNGTDGWKSLKGEWIIGMNGVDIMNGRMKWMCGLMAWMGGRDGYSGWYESLRALIEGTGAGPYGKEL